MEYVVQNAIQENFYFIVTNSRIIYNKKDDRKTIENQLKLVHRENGKSISSEGLKIYEYSRGTMMNTFPLNTDNSANFKFPVSQDNEYYRFYLVQQPKTNDFNLMQVYGNRYYGEDFRNQNQNSAQILLDRAIYRPGQTVYFKVIDVYKRQAGTRRRPVLPLHQRQWLRHDRLCTGGGSRSASPGLCASRRPRLR